MSKRILAIRTFIFTAITVFFHLVLSGQASAQSLMGSPDPNTAGVREVVIAGLIIAFLTAIYSVILTQKGEDEDGEACGCGKKSKYT